MYALSTNSLYTYTRLDFKSYPLYILEPNNNKIEMFDINKIV